MANQFFQEWYFYAKSDFDQVLDMKKKANPHYHIGIYHLHQSVEKLLKLVILMHPQQVEPPRTHDLLKLSIKAAESFPEIVSQQDSLIDLHEYLPRLRYPTGDRITQDDLDICFAKVEPVIKILCQKIDEFM